MKLVWSRQAKADMRAIHDQIAADYPIAAKAVIGRIRNAALQLETFPELGMPLADMPAFMLIEGRRGYRIIYEVETDKGIVRVLYVIHPRRDRP